ncbi:MAG: hypothetical protein NT163_03190 [Chlorobiales bacterium]|nr:hypothetical protein [Chlorobiales bacterium]
MENNILLLVLTLIPGIGPARIKAITRHLHNRLTDSLPLCSGKTSTCKHPGPFDCRHQARITLRQTKHCPALP